MSDTYSPNHAPFLGKWLRILFWLIVPSTLAGVLGNDSVKEFSPALYNVGQVMSALCNVAYGAILFKLSPAEKRYRTAGMCLMFSSVAGMAVLDGLIRFPVLSLLALPAAVAGLVGQYNEFMAHSAVLSGVDDALAAKWAKLWNLYILFMVAAFASSMLLLISSVLALIISVAALIGTTVVSIMKLIYLYKTANAFP